CRLECPQARTDGARPAQQTPWSGGTGLVDQDLLASGDALQAAPQRSRRAGDARWFAEQAQVGASVRRGRRVRWHSRAVAQEQVQLLPERAVRGRRAGARAGQAAV